ncbi:MULTISPECIES: YfaZ family outer membrane protein [Aliagarivorans]|uniref:YfaZ family outer membrane protein n=1 Tax=Aliagarivorans TaxID=882379 RepID=UPI0004202267|nr:MULTISPECIES: YfaZ family outer membrane protein [Aliagarivorans]
MFKRALMIAGAVALSGAANASQLSLELNNRSVATGLVAQLGPNAQFFADYTYNERHGNLINAGLRAIKTVDQHNFGVGMKYVGLDARHGDNANGAAFGVNYSTFIAPKVSVATSAHYAPSVLLSSSIDSYYDWDVKASYAMMDNLDLYTGYKLSRFNYERADHLKFDNRVYLGARFRF